MKYTITIELPDELSALLEMTRGAAKTLDKPEVKALAEDLDLTPVKVAPVSRQDVFAVARNLVRNGKQEEAKGVLVSLGISVPLAQAPEERMPEIFEALSKIA